MLLTFKSDFLPRVLQLLHFYTAIVRKHELNRTNHNEENAVYVNVRLRPWKPKFIYIYIYID